MTNVIDMGLTPKQQAFVEEYLKDLNATQAAERAGYSTISARQQGSENLSKPAVAAAICAAQLARQARTRIDADYVLQTIRETIEQARNGQPLLDAEGNPVMMRDHEGQLVCATVFSASMMTVVLKACEQLGRHLGLWKDVKLGIGGLPIEEDETPRSDLDTARRLTLILSNGLKQLNS